MLTSLPMIEVTDHGNFFGIGSPNGKECSGLTVRRSHVCPELFVKFEMLSGPEQMNVEIGKQRKACRLFFNLTRLLSHGVISLAFLFSIFIFLRVTSYVVVNTSQRNDHPIRTTIKLVTEFVDCLFDQECSDQDIVFVGEFLTEAHLFEICTEEETGNVMLPLLGPLFEELEILLSIVFVQ